MVITNATEFVAETERVTGSRPSREAFAVALDTTREWCETVDQGGIMTTRSKAPLGSPCWVDLWTSDVEGSRTFYSELFGWEALEPSPEFGGYFMFTRDGVPVAGGMGDMADLKADNTWKIYLDTPDIATTAHDTEAAGGKIDAPIMAVADLGTQFVFTDPSGARLGAWQAGTFPGFTVLEEPGAPSWFELYTRDFAGAVEFYSRVFHWKIEPMSDTDEFRYSLLLNPSGEGELAGIMDALSFLPAGAPDHWEVYWDVENVATSVERAQALGGQLVQGPNDTPYGILAGLEDPSGARFNIRARQ
jgi:predicted enzyme related to lactoylglutathione lyase